MIRNAQTIQTNATTATATGRMRCRRDLISSISISYVTFASVIAADSAPRHVVCSGAPGAWNQATRVPEIRSQPRGRLRNHGKRNARRAPCAIPALCCESVRLRARGSDTIMVA